jgi:hypothetical protein
VDFLKRGEFGIPFRDFVLCQGLFWIGDWLHLMKNGRVKLFGKKIVINPQDISARASIDGIAQCFERPPTFTDNGSLGKMRDCYPLDLFNLRRVHVLYQRGENIDEFLDIFILGLWTEVVENRLFNSDTRIHILETLMDFFYVQYSFIIVNKKHRLITQKKAAGKTYVGLFRGRNPRGLSAHYPVN